MSIASHHKVEECTTYTCLISIGHVADMNWSVEFSVATSIHSFETVNDDFFIIANCFRIQTYQAIY